MNCAENNKDSLQLKQSSREKNPPVVVLVETEHPHNIGFCARALSCYGLPDLRLVRKDSLEMPVEAWVTGSSALDVMQQAKVYSTLQEALADCSFAVGFSRRQFDSVLPCYSLEELPGSLPAGLRAAFVFGRESTGLRTEEISVCACQCEIPLPKPKSFNLGQAVAVALYGWYTLAAIPLNSPIAPSNQQNSEANLITSPLDAGSRNTTIEELEKLISFVGGQLDGRRTSIPKAQQSLRKMLQRMACTRAEYDMLFGIMRGLSGSRARNEKKSREDA